MVLIHTTNFSGKIDLHSLAIYNKELYNILQRSLNPLFYKIIVGTNKKDV